MLSACSNCIWKEVEVTWDQSGQQSKNKSKDFDFAYRHNIETLASLYNHKPEYLDHYVSLFCSLSEEPFGFTEARKIKKFQKRDEEKEKEKLRTIAEKMDAN